MYYLHLILTGLAKNDIAIHYHNNMVRVKIVPTLDKIKKLKTRILRLFCKLDVFTIN